MCFFSLAIHFILRCIRSLQNEMKYLFRLVYSVIDYTFTQYNIEINQANKKLAEFKFIFLLLTE